MEENELYDRIGETDLNPTYKDGQPYMHTDVNQMLGIIKTAVNENYHDIQKMQNGEKTVGDADQLDGATLSRYIDEPLQADDNKIPSSQQVMAHIDERFSEYDAPVRGVDYWTEEDKEEIIDAAINETDNTVNESVFLGNIICKKYYDDISSTIYYITEIPYHNEKGEQNVWKIGIAHDDITLSSKQSTLDFAKSKNASICINSARGISRLGGILIKDGIILNFETTTTLGKILGIKPDGSFVFFPVDTPAQTVLESGCTNALVAFDTFIENGEAVPYDHGNGLEPNPRQVICRKTNGDYLIFTCNGREQYDVGMTVADMQRILLARNDIDCAYNLDGGGSTSTVIDLQKINKDIDNHYEDREVVVFLYMDKTDKDYKDMYNIYKLLSDFKQEINERLVNLEVLSGKLKLFADGTNPDIEFYNNGEREYYDGRLRLNDAGFNIRWRPDANSDYISLLSATDYFLRFKDVPFGEFMNYCTNSASETDLNDITRQGFYIATSNTLNVPKSATFVILHINSSSSYDVQQQIAIPLGTNAYMYCRRKLSGSDTWGGWTPINLFVGNTNGRPSTNLTEGMQYYDTTLGKPIWYNGTNWIDATGTQV